MFIYRFFILSLISTVFIFTASGSGFNNNNLPADDPANKLAQVQLAPQSLSLAIPGELQGIVGNPIFANFQKKIGYKFKDPELLILALRHSSFDKGHTASRRGNERLEFFGDAVLEHIIRDMLWHEFPHLNNGDLRNTCTNLVTNESLSFISEIIKLPEISQSLNLSPQCVLNENGKANFVEALIAAIHEDGGLDASKIFVRKFWRSNSAPKKLQKTFKKLAAELKALQSNGAGKILTRKNYDKKYDDSLSFLGEGVLGIVIKNYFCREFLKETEGDLTKKYAVVSSIEAINKLCKVLCPNEKHASLKKRLGQLYLEDGLEKTSNYILSLWTSEEAPDNIYDAFVGAGIPELQDEFLPPEQRSSFLAMSKKVAQDHSSEVVEQKTFTPALEIVVLAPPQLNNQGNIQKQVVDPSVSERLQKKANKVKRAQELKAKVRAAALKKSAAQSAADLARNAALRKASDLVKKAAAQKAEVLAKNAAAQSAAAAQRAALLAKKAEAQLATAAHKAAIIKQRQDAEYLSEKIDLLIDKGDSFFRNRWFHDSYAAYKKASEIIPIMDWRCYILEGKTSEAHKMMKIVDDIKRGQACVNSGDYNQASNLFQNIMSNLKRDDPLYREAFYSNNEANMLRVRDSIIMGHHLFNAGEHEVALDSYMRCLVKLENAPYHNYILHTEVLKAIDRTNKAIADKNLPVIDKVLNWFGSVFK